jgi:hypothetical protein
MWAKASVIKGLLALMGLTTVTDAWLRAKKREPIAIP